MKWPEKLCPEPAPFALTWKGWEKFNQDYRAAHPAKFYSIAGCRILLLFAPFALLVQFMEQERPGEV